MASTVAVNSFRKSGSPVGKGILVPVKASETIIKGCMCKWSGGYIVNGADAAGRFAGIAMETVTGGASDGLVYTWIRIKGVYAFAKTGGSAATDAGVLATCKDNNLYGLVGDTTNDEFVGLIVGWDTATGVWASGAKALIDIGIRA